MSHKGSEQLLRARVVRRHEQQHRGGENGAAAEAAGPHEGEGPASAEEGGPRAAAALRGTAGAQRHGSWSGEGKRWQNRHPVQERQRFGQLQALDCGAPLLHHANRASGHPECERLSRQSKGPRPRTLRSPVCYHTWGLIIRSMMSHSVGSFWGLGRTSGRKEAGPLLSNGPILPPTRPPKACILRCLPLSFPVASAASVPTNRHGHLQAPNGSLAQQRPTACFLFLRKSGPCPKRHHFPRHHPQHQNMYNGVQSSRTQTVMPKLRFPKPGSS